MSQESQDPGAATLSAVRRPLTLLWIASVALAATLISVFSGFHSYAVPFDLAWQFSPIGLLGGVRPEYAGLGSHAAFAGSFGWSFDYLTVFLKTCVFESPFYYYCFRNRRFPEFVALLLTSNFLTHPLVFFVFPALFQRYLASALAAEAFAAGVEMAFVGWLLSRTGPKRAAWIGAVVILAANLFSWEMGMFF